jgi:sulfur carrier protein
VKILVNGAWRDTNAADVAAALKEFGYGDSAVATALNGEFVATGARPSALLTDGDRLEVLAPMQGG